MSACEVTTALRSAWSIPEGVTYLNHGSFGPTPVSVQAVRTEWSTKLAAQPMDFYLRKMEPALDDAAAVLGEFIDIPAADLCFVDNATVAMNIVAQSLALRPGDEVVLNNHEYGAVRRIWQAACTRQQANLIQPVIPTPIQSTDDILSAIFTAVTPRTKLIVVSHVTSPTAIVFPVAEICRRANALKIPVCIDGPHAIAMLPLSLKKLGCAFYCASLHKWLSAPLGSGFLYVRRDWQQKLSPPVVSWGRSLGGRASRWQDDYNWLGTRDPAPFLAVPSAIKFLEDIGVEAFREHGHTLAKTVRERLTNDWQVEALIPDDAAWYGTMVTIPLPPGPILRPKPQSWDPLQAALWERYRIEAPIMDWSGRRHLRVSCHAYNNRDDLDRLFRALGELPELVRPSEVGRR
ncbi:MAG: aminotransferase class V-fold PLP-dependent enzyme [Planctomycetaceae bacterium]|nr:aminotransferase class V-fold PLP-dependent enzyme [Planctomycetaceae bacterium]